MDKLNLIPRSPTTDNEGFGILQVPSRCDIRDVGHTTCEGAEVSFQPKKNFHSGQLVIVNDRRVNIELRAGTRNNSKQTDPGPSQCVIDTEVEMVENDLYNKCVNNTSSESQKGVIVST